MKNKFSPIYSYKIKTLCFHSFVSGTAIPCGSGCFQTACGSYFLGKPSLESIQEARSLLRTQNKKMKRFAHAFLTAANEEE